MNLINTTSSTLNVGNEHNLLYIPLAIQYKSEKELQSWTPKRAAAAIMDFELYACMHPF